MQTPFYARTDGTRITQVLLDITTLPGGSAVDLSPATVESEGGTEVSYVSASSVGRNLSFAVNWVRGDGDSLLETGETAELVIDVGAERTAGEAFVITVRPVHGLPAAAQIPAQPTGTLDAVIPYY